MFVTTRSTAPPARRAGRRQETFGAGRPARDQAALRRSSPRSFVFFDSPGTLGPRGGAASLALSLAPVLAFEPSGGAAGVSQDVPLGAFFRSRLSFSWEGARVRDRGGGPPGAAVLQRRTRAAARTHRRRCGLLRGPARPADAAAPPPDVALAAERPRRGARAHAWKAKVPSARLDYAAGSVSSPRPRAPALLRRRSRRDSMPGKDARLWLAAGVAVSRAHRA